MKMPAAGAAAGIFMIVSVIAARPAWRRLGAQTGNLLGATEQLAGIAALIVFAAILA